MKDLKEKAPISLAGVIIKDGEDYLLIEEGTDLIPEMAGKLNFPMGIIKEGESPYDCALREGSRKTGYHIKIIGRTSLGTHAQKDSYDVFTLKLYLFEATIVGERKKDSKCFWHYSDYITFQKEVGPPRHVLTVIADHEERLLARRAPGIVKKKRE